MSSSRRTTLRVPDLVPGDRHHELAAITALMRKQVVPADRLAGIVEQLGSAVLLVQRSEEDRLFRPESPTDAFIGAVGDEDVSTAYLNITEWLQAGRDVRSVLDADYPVALRAIYNRPPFIFVRGVWDEDRDWHSVAVVGTRLASDDGLRRAAKLSRELVAAGFTVVSGLAAGIDTAAHRAALAAQGRTVAVLGTGIDRMYPAENTPLAEAIVASGGCLISQFFPTQPPTQWTFPKRNVVMSGVTLATIVVEASSTSGAKMQARIALEHGRSVFLLRSLVEQHEWAKRYVEDGIYGTRAIMISSTQEILDRVSGREERLLVA